MEILRFKVNEVGMLVAILMPFGETFGGLNDAKMRQVACQMAILTPFGEVYRGLGEETGARGVLNLGVPLFWERFSMKTASNMEVKID